MSRPRILFVDDQRSARDLFARRLDAARYEPFVAGSVAEARAEMRRIRPDVVITDLRMPEVDGLQALDLFHQIDPDVPIILVTAFGTVETAVQAMKRGAFDYLRKPFEPAEIELVLERALKHQRLVRENERLRSEVSRKFSRDNIVCRSAAMSAVLQLVDRVAHSDVPVLIQGESGTGKDLIAKLVHYSSSRANAPFVSINCSAIPDHLLESELFGYARGAFSGATSARAGFFAQAEGGTMFLDEIGDMSSNLQPKLLHVLQNGEFYPVGNRQVMRADVRVICASNQDIPALVESGRFRQDLYYRINTVSISLPALRDRREEIPLLVDHFLASRRERAAGGPERVGGAAMRALLEYRWPGNVRELEHAIDHAALVCDGAEICPEHLPSTLREVVPGASPEHEPVRFKEARRQFERDYFRRLLDTTEGCIQRAAELAGIHRTTLYEKLAKLELSTDDR